ncbi:MAG: MATE family efflux transporter [Spirochaetes bacterium]|nr:MATE family efflux transporter [Spirochaetota bacterium]
MVLLLKELLSIAIPMVISQVSDTVMLFVDRWMLSRLGELHLAAAMSGGLSQFTLTSFFVGMVGYVNALTAQSFGARRKDLCAPVVYQGIYLSLAAYPVLLLMAPLMQQVFFLLGHREDQVTLEYTYFKVLIWGSVFPILRAAFTGFFLGIGRTRVVMVANVIGMLVNLPANYALIYGNWGFPAWGVQGAALGTILGSISTVLILILAFVSPSNRASFKTHRIKGLDLLVLAKLVRYGGPAGAELFFNVTAFNVFVLLMHSYGPGVAAAVTVAFNWDLVAFIPMLGMGEAVTSMVGRRVGAGNFVEARKVVYTALATAWIYSASMMVLFLVAAPQLVGVFLSDTLTTSFPLAVFMLRLAGLYTLADSAQIVFSGALRGGGDTKAVMSISVGLHWAFSLLAVGMIKYGNVSPPIVWIAFILFVMMLGFSMFLRFRLGHWASQRILG